MSIEMEETNITPDTEDRNLDEEEDVSKTSLSSAPSSRRFLGKGRGNIQCTRGNTFNEQDEIEHEENLRKLSDQNGVDNFLDRKDVDNAGESAAAESCDNVLGGEPTSTLDSLSPFRGDTDVSSSSACGNYDINPDLEKGLAVVPKLRRTGMATTVGVNGPRPLSDNPANLSPLSSSSQSTRRSSPQLNSLLETDSDITVTAVQPYNHACRTRHNSTDFVHDLPRHNLHDSLPPDRPPTYDAPRPLHRLSSNSFGSIGTPKLCPGSNTFTEASPAELHPRRTRRSQSTLLPEISRSIFPRVTPPHLSQLLHDTEHSGWLGRRPSVGVGQYHNTTRRPSNYSVHSNTSCTWEGSAAATGETENRGCCQCHCHGISGPAPRDQPNKDKEGTTISDIASSVFGEISSTNVVSLTDLLPPSLPTIYLTNSHYILVYSFA